MSDASSSSSSSPISTPNNNNNIIRHYRNVNEINKRYKTGITKPSTTTTMLGKLIILTIEFKCLKCLYLLTFFLKKNNYYYYFSIIG